MASSLLPETAQKVLTHEAIRSAAKQSNRCLTVPVKLCRAIKKYLRDQDEPHMKRKVLRLSESFTQIKDVHSQLTASTSKQLFEDPLGSDQSQRWKIKSCYGDIGLTYRDDQTIAYVASRMPAVFSACLTVLKERSKGGQPLRGSEDEKFSFIAVRRGQRPREPWPLDGVKFETLEEQHANRNLEDLEIDYEDQEDPVSSQQASLVPFGKQDPTNYDSDVVEVDDHEDIDEEKEEDNTGNADLGRGWRRIIYTPVRRGKQVTMDVCRSTNEDASEGTLERIVVKKNKNPTLHKQARKSIWGDLWPF